MQSPLLKERRMGQRKRLTGLLPGTLKAEEGERPISCRPVDISQQGIGILSRDELKDGAILALQLPDQIIRLKVAWQQPDFGKQNMLRYGLVCTDQTINLEAIFAAAGCLI